MTPAEVSARRRRPGSPERDRVAVGWGAATAADPIERPRRPEAPAGDLGGWPRRRCGPARAGWPAIGRAAAARRFGQSWRARRR